MMFNIESLSRNVYQKNMTRVPIAFQISTIEFFRRENTPIISTPTVSDRLLKRDGRVYVQIVAPAGHP